MPEILRNVNYDYADRQSVIELLESIQKLEKKPEEYLDGVTDTQLRGLMKNDLESYVKIKQIAESLAYDILTKEEAMGKFQDFTNTVQGMHFLENFEKYKEKTDYEFVRHENYQNLTKIAEDIERIKVKTEYMRANLKAREVMSKYGEKEKHFSRKKWNFMEADELIPLEERQKIMENELQKAKDNLAYLNSDSYKEEQEKAQKDIQKKREIYNKIKTLTEEKDNISTSISDFSDRQKTMQDAYDTVNVQLNQITQDEDNNAKAWEDFRLKWNLEFDVESDIRMKVDEIRSVEKELAELSLQENNQEKMQEMLAKNSKLNIELMNILMEANCDDSMLTEFRQLIEQSENLSIEKREKLLEQNRLQKEIEDIKSQQDTILSQEEKIKQLEKEISAGLTELGLKSSQLTSELMEKIEAAFERQEKEWSNEVLEQKKLAASNVIKNIENDMKEVHGYNTYVQENIMQRFENFSVHILDGSKDKTQKNSDEFEEMRKELAEFVKDKDKLSPAQYAERVQMVKESAEKYLAAKKAQIRLIPSTQRRVRMEFAQNLVAHCEYTLENEKFNLVTKSLETSKMEAEAREEDRGIQLKNRITQLEKKAEYLKELAKDMYLPIANNNFIYDIRDIYLSSTDKKKEEMVLPRMIGSLGATGDEAEIQGFVNRFFDDFDKDKSTNIEDREVFRKAFKQYSEAENSPEKMKELMENAIRRIGNYIQNQPAEVSEKQIVMGAFMKRFLKVCEQKNVQLSDETKNLANGITLLGKVARESLKTERALLTNNIEPQKSYEDVLKRYTAMKMLENRLFKGNDGKVIDNLSSMGVAMNSDEALDKVTDLVGNTKGFKDFKACSPKSRAYIISSNNKLTSKLYEDISKQCTERSNEVKLEAEKVKDNKILS